jgi:hypothetical protein
MNPQKFIRVTSREINTIFTIPEDVATKSEVIKQHNAKDTGFYFHINRAPEHIHNLIDFMSGQEYKQTNTLTALIKELKINMKEEKKVDNFNHGVKIFQTEDFEKLSQPKIRFYHDLLMETNNEEYKSKLNEQSNFNISVMHYLSIHHISGTTINSLKILELELTELSKKNKIMDIKIFDFDNKKAKFPTDPYEIKTVIIKYREEPNNMAIFKINCSYDELYVVGYQGFQLFDLIAGQCDNGYEILFKKINRFV